MSCTCHAPHRGPVLTLAWRTALDVQSRVVVGPGAHARLADVLRQLHSGNRVLILFQPGAGEHQAAALLGPLEKENFEVVSHQVQDGEACKDVDCLLRIWALLQEKRFDRRDSIVAVGGGAVCDLAGFAASTFKRGLNLALLPTTLLAQVDASIGGKNGINLASAKNLAGTFYFPGAVMVDPLALSTLPKRQFASGMAEVIKYALIEETIAQNAGYTPGPRPLLDFLEQVLDGTFNYDDPALPGIVISCIKMKLLVVGRDPYESGLRRTLNLGHTLGHALEKVSGYELTHGEAISIGMVFALRLSVKKRLLGAESLDRVTDILTRVGLPLDVPPGMDRNKLMDAIGHDKKRHGDTIKFVLPKARLGAVDFNSDLSVKELSELI